MRVLYVVVGVAGAALVGTAVGWWTGASRARENEERKQGEVLIASNRVWIARLDSIGTAVTNAQLEASSANAAAAELRRARRAIPAPPLDAPASVLANYWEGQAMSAEHEADSLQVAFNKEKQASAGLRLSVDSLRKKLDLTSHALGKSLDREQGKQKILGFIPRPPKIVAAAIGCIVGAVVDQRDAARGCGLGGTTLTVVLPTR